MREVMSGMRLGDGKNCVVGLECDIDEIECVGGSAGKDM